MGVNGVCVSGGVPLTDGLAPDRRTFGTEKRARPNQCRPGAWSQRVSSGDAEKVEEGSFGVFGVPIARARLENELLWCILDGHRWSQLGPSARFQRVSDACLNPVSEWIAMS